MFWIFLYNYVSSKKKKTTSLESAKLLVGVIALCDVHNDEGGLDSSGIIGDVIKVRKRYWLI